MLKTSLRLLWIGITLLLCTQLNLAQSIVPPDVPITQMVWTGAYAEKEGITSKMKVETEDDLKWKIAIRTLHALTIKNNTQKTISAIEYMFAVVNDLTVVGDKMEVLVKAKMRQGTLQIKPGESRIVAGAYFEPALSSSSLKKLLDTDEIYCQRIYKKHCVYAFVNITRIEYSDGSYYQEPSISDSELQAVAREKGLLRVQDWSVPVSLHQVILDIPKSGLAVRKEK